MCRGRLSRTLALLSLVVVAACARSAGAPEPVAPTNATRASPAEDARLTFGPPRPEDAWLEVAWAASLPALHVVAANTRATIDLHLYARNGSVDPEALQTFSNVAADANGAFPLRERLVQLAVKAAHHFDVHTLEIVSAYRKARTKDSGDHHSKGEALDFRLPGVDYRKLAVYLRSLPRVGVGVYTDRRTHYVHLDVRDKSFHWLDASPPGVTWREAALPDANQAARDAAYGPESDLPLDRAATSPRRGRT